MRNMKLINVQIKCWENILDSDLPWRERETVHRRIADLYTRKYALQHVEGAYVRLDDLVHCPPNGCWYLEEDF